MAFNPETLSTYELLWGIPGRSNALAIASRLGLDAQVLEGRSNCWHRRGMAK